MIQLRGRIFNLHNLIAGTLLAVCAFLILGGTADADARDVDSLVRREIAAENELPDRMLNPFIAGGINGRVSERGFDGAGIVDADITIRRADGTLVTRLKSGRNGFYTYLLEPPLGLYRVTVAKSSFQTATKSFLNNGPGADTLDFQLSRRVASPPPPPPPVASGGDAAARTAFVLSGGGSKGAFEVGVIKKLYEAGIKPDILIGASVGALNAAKLAEGGNSLEELYDLWMSLSGSNAMFEQQPWFKNLNEKLEDLERQSSDLEALGDLRVAFSLLKDFQNAIGRATSLYNLDPIANCLQYCLDPNKIVTSGKQLRVATVDLRSGNLALIDERGVMRIEGASIEHSVDLRKAIIASASIPVIFPVQSLGPVGSGIDLMVDGGVREMAPLETARELGADLIFVILASPPKLDPKSGSTMSRLAMEVAGRTLDILVNEVAVNDISSSLGGKHWVDLPYKYEDNITVIFPQINLYDGLVVTPALIRLYVDYGWMIASDVLQGRSPERTKALIRSANSIVYSVSQGQDDIWRIKATRADYGSDYAHQKAMKAITEAAYKRDNDAVRERRRIGGEIPVRLLHLLEGGGPAAPVFPQKRLGNLVGRSVDDAERVFRGQGFEVQVAGPRGRYAVVTGQDPAPFSSLTAGCRVTLTSTLTSARCTSQQDCNSGQWCQGGRCDPPPFRLACSPRRDCGANGECLAFRNVGSRIVNLGANSCTTANLRLFPDAKCYCLEP